MAAVRIGIHVVQSESIDAVSHCVLLKQCQLMMNATAFNLASLEAKK
jgi:hypothetical protein